MLDQTLPGNDRPHLAAEPLALQIAPPDKTKDPHLLICKEGELPAESWGPEPAAVWGGGGPDITGPHVTLIGSRCWLCAKLRAIPH